MAIDRHKLVSRHNPILDRIDTDSPMTVGNGRIAFTADITGTQTLYDHYAQGGFPLCTMAEWGWHTIPYLAGKTPREGTDTAIRELRLTEYATARGIARYAVQKYPGSEKAYDWLRQNPHRMNLCRISLKYDGSALLPGDIIPVRQELHCYSGVLESNFLIRGQAIRVAAACDPETDTLAFAVSRGNGTGQESALPPLTVEICFPFGNSSISGSDWASPLRHRTTVARGTGGAAHIARTLDNDRCSVGVSSGDHEISSNEKAHTIRIEPHASAKVLTFALIFTPGNGCPQPPSPETVFENSRVWWKDFWETGGAVDFSGSTNPHAGELERRIILSQYLLAAQSCGTIPPAETGLTCNSWYGKFHLEMHPLHAAWLPLWNRSGLLERSLPWYKAHLGKAKENAEKNGYAGARWPKMVADDADDSPSPIAPLLVWQQPHILYLLSLVHSAAGKGREFLERYRDTVYETAVFMADFAAFDPVAGTWNIEAPVIPVQEEHRPETVRNPAFEVEYWRYGLRAASAWLTKLGETVPDKWGDIILRMAGMPVRDGLYAAHDNCGDTFASFNRDHPSMLMALGYLDGDRVDPERMERTLHKVIDCWDYQSLWGWDFAMMSMTAALIGDKDLAVQTLLADTPKNTYTASGNNYQKSRADLPLYLPGNGSLLLAVARLASGRATDSPFPDDGGWTVQIENIHPFPGSDYYNT